MKDINLYIVEKLKINKDTKDDTINTDTVVACIMDICNLDPFNSNCKDIFYELDVWAQENKLSEFIGKVNCYCNLDTVKKNNHNFYNHLVQSGWLDHIKGANPAMNKLVPNYMDKEYLVAENTKYPSHGRLFKIDDHGNSDLIYFIQHYNIYFYFTPIKDI